MKTLFRILICFLLPASIACAETLYMNGIRGNDTNSTPVRNNTGTFYVGGENNVGSDRVVRQQNLAYDGTGTRSAHLSVFNNLTAAKAFDGIIGTGEANSFHSGANTAGQWVQVQLAEPAAASHVVVYNRSDQLGRLGDFTLAVYDDDPTVSGSNVVWSATGAGEGRWVFYNEVNPAGLTGNYFRMTHDKAEWFHLSEIQVLSAADDGGYGSVITADGKQFIGTDFDNGTGTLVFDLDFGAGGISYDTLSVGGTFYAGGTLQLNFSDFSNLQDGSYTLITAGAFDGQFATINISQDVRDAIDGLGLLFNESALNQGVLSLTDGVTWTAGNNNSDLSAAGNWTGAPAGKSLFFGNEPSESVSATLNTTLQAKGLGAATAAGSSASLTIGAGGVLELGTGANLVNSDGMAIKTNAFGHAGNATLNITDDGRLEIAGPAHFGNTAGKQLTLNLSGGELKMTSATDEFVLGTKAATEINVSGNHAFSSAAVTHLTDGTVSNRLTVNQTGGSVRVTHADGLQVGKAGNAAGAPEATYNLSAGTLETPKFVQNENATGRLNLSGGAAAVGELGVFTYMTGGELAVSEITDTVRMMSGTLTPGDFGTAGNRLTVAPGGSLHIYEGSLVADRTNNVAMDYTGIDPVGKPASQISTYNAGTPASNANDGKKADDEAENLSTHTSATTSHDWWQVEIGTDGMKNVGAVTIYNRYNDGWRLTYNGRNHTGAQTGYHFELYDGTIDNIGNPVWQSETYWDYSNVNNEGHTIYFDNFNLDTGVLRLVRDVPDGADQRVLNLREVEVYPFSTDASDLLDAPVVQFYIDSNGADSIFVENGGTLDLDGAIMEILFVNDTPVAGSWQFVEFEDQSVDLADVLANVRWFKQDYTGFEWSDLGGGAFSLSSTGGAVPEPATWVMLLLGLAGLGWVRWRRR